ncbi:tRNA threonylcarbamoyladenosine biosynthesis protein TsaB [Noviherbaspirillum humi]|uniref:tRNA threonylcarbamoyladenosine biosynthesis protein TsaB n=1 Tax=Noviherbaspirillum humi TaxID=1688639 RepID=A0A239FZK3_9BURK|nr:tRNA (adenosine(37)-N6)-threonylcarbamoyltransferase complex dimerization subunit type 1 TsaB [Noviherbaspirillum humi]SNS62341.1 tRNA threonylcarbamoyladenosine biosynthesis protein TsaB [Noviherbaspirillum humi]
MPILLAIETSTEEASVALLHDGRLTSRQTSGVQTHSQTVLPMAQQLLAESGLALSRCDAIAFGAGPGSFTGVRTACGVAQGLAFGADLPVVPVVTLLAMAQACREQTGADDVLAVLDARMEEVYWAQYRFDGTWQVVTEPALTAASAVRAQGAPTACGNGLNAYAAAFGDAGFNAGARPDIMPHAASVAMLAAIDFAAGRIVTAAEAQPLYLRNKVALTTEERMAKVAS